jgi:hypothetical protein
VFVQAGAPQLIKTMLSFLGIGFVIGTVGPMLVGGFVNGAIFAFSAARLTDPEAAVLLVVAAAELLPLELALELELELELELPQAVTPNANVAASATVTRRFHSQCNDPSPLLVPQRLCVAAQTPSMSAIRLLRAAQQLSTR